MSPRTRSDTRWGGGRRVNFAEGRQHILDAAALCFRQLGIRKTTITDIAMQARITRPTVYRYFNSYDDILKSAVRSDLEQLWGDLIRFSDAPDLHHFLVEALIQIIDRIRTPDTLPVLSRPEALPALEEILLTDGNSGNFRCQMLGTAAARFRGSGQIFEVHDLPTLSEFFHRLMVSYTMRPSAHHPKPSDLKHLFGTYLAPFQLPTSPTMELRVTAASY